MDMANKVAMALVRRSAVGNRSGSEKIHCRINPWFNIERVSKSSATFHVSGITVIRSWRILTVVK
jgi:hypothetical protein